MKIYRMCLLAAVLASCLALLHAEVIDITGTPHVISSTEPVKPSFDCAKAKSSAERLICVDSELAAAEKRMAERYKEALQSLTREQQELLKQDQRSWQTERNRRCENSQVCKSVLEGRTDELIAISDPQAPERFLLGQRSSLRALVCQHEIECSVHKFQIAGTNSLGQTIGVLVVRHDDPRESIWRVVQTKERVFAAQKITDYEEESDWGPNSFKVSANELTVAKLGHGSSYSFTVSLNPLQPVRTAYSEYHPMADSIRANWSWDWKEFSGKGDADEEYGGGGKFLVIPQVPIDSGFWDKIPLGNCSLALRYGNGFLLAGHLESSSQPIVKALLTDKRVLVVNVYGGPWTKEALNWLHDDHLEIWKGWYFDAVEGSSYHGKSIAQWGVRIADGKVFQAYGDKTDRLDVKVKDLSVPNGQTVRALRIALPPLKSSEDQREEMIAISYSAGDGKNRVKWLLSTSQVKYGIPHTFSVVESINPGLATCLPSSGTLNVQLATDFDPDAALF
jgi:uncharacterized protein